MFILLKFWFLTAKPSHLKQHTCPRHRHRADRGTAASFLSGSGPSPSVNRARALTLSGSAEQSASAVRRLALSEIRNPLISQTPGQGGSRSRKIGRASCRERVEMRGVGGG